MLAHRVNSFGGKVGMYATATKRTRMIHWNRVNDGKVLGSKVRCPQPIDTPCRTIGVECGKDLLERRARKERAHDFDKPRVTQDIARMCPKCAKRNIATTDSWLANR